MEGGPEQKKKGFWKPLRSMEKIGFMFKKLSKPEHLLKSDLTLKKCSLRWMKNKSNL